MAMSTSAETAETALLTHLNRLAQESLALWSVPANARVRLINVSENTTYLVEGPGEFRSILRVHRAHYHTQRAIACELAWMEALNREGGVTCPKVMTGHNGKAVQEGAVPGLPTRRYMVMFAFVTGVHPDEGHDLTGPFEQLGEIAAKTHQHSLSWRRPEPFVRPVWDTDGVYGPMPIWGNWRDGPNIDARTRSILERVEERVRRRLALFGKAEARYGLIHADMRLANLLIDKGKTRLIDFDDCGFGWFMYDFAAAISFIEDDPQIPALRVAWIRGYRKVRTLTVEDERELDSFIMLRRMALLAWIGSHSGVPEAQAMAPDFARISAALGEVYLAERA